MHFPGAGRTPARPPLPGVCGARFAHVLRALMTHASAHPPAAAVQGSGPGRQAATSLRERNAASLRALDVPCGPLLGPRVEHLLAPRPGLLSDTVAEALQLPKVRGVAGGSSASVPGLCQRPQNARRAEPRAPGRAQAFVLELLRFGAVFFSVVPPAVPAEAARGMSAELAAASAAARAAAAPALDAVRRPCSARPLAGEH